MGGSLLVTLSFANVWLADVADDQATRIRTTLRRELAAVPDETLTAFPDSAEEVATAAERALARDGEGGRVLRVAQPDRDEVVVSVEAGLAWQRRCIEAELRGGGTVLTDQDGGPC